MSTEDCQFFNPILLEVHNSYDTMNKKIDFLLKFFYCFLSEHIPFQSTELKRSIIMEVKNFAVPMSLEEIKEEYEYIDPITLHKNFTDFEELVIDSEGYIREKNEPYNNKGIYTKKPVTLIPSSDIKKIQKDQKNLEKKFSEMSEMFCLMLVKMDEQTKIIIEQNKTIASQNVKIDELLENTREKDRKIDAMQVQINNLTTSLKNAEYKIENQDNRLAIQEKTIASYENQLNRQAEHIELQDKKLDEAKNALIKFSNENAELRKLYGDESLKNRIQKENFRNMLYGVKSQINPENPEGEVFESIPLVDDKWVGRKWKPLTGMRDTFSIFTTSRVLLQEKQENSFRRAAFEGDCARMQRLLSRNKNIINGRGMPDALCSLAKGFKDKTALMLASQQGHLNCVNFLLENQAQINFLDRDNFTALDYAQQNHHGKVEELLIKQGAINGTQVLRLFEQKSSDEMVNSFHMMENNQRAPQTTIQLM